MSVSAVPSRLKKLSLIISQITLLSSGLVSQVNAQAVCTEELVAGVPKSIDSKLVGNVCDLGNGMGAVSLTVNADIDATGERVAVSMRQGQVTLADGVTVTATDKVGSNLGVAGVDIESNEAISAVVGENVTIDARHSGVAASTNSFAAALGLDGDAGKNVSATVGAGSLLKATAIETDNGVSASSSAVRLNVDSHAAVVAASQIQFNAQSATLTASSEHGGSGVSKAEALDVWLDGETENLSLDADLMGGHLQATASSSGVAKALGMNVDGGAASSGSVHYDLNLNGTRVDAVSRGASAEATALNVNDHSTTAKATAVVRLEGVQLSASTTGSSLSAAKGVQLDIAQASLNLINSSVVASAQGAGTQSAMGIWSEQGNVSVNVDASSRIEASVAVLLEGANGTLNNSGSIKGAVQANTVTVKNNGVIAGTVSAQTLNVESGGELQAVMQDSHAPNTVFFSAQDVTLANGAKVHINATSEAFNPKTPGVNYTIVSASNALTADAAQLNLKSSGLVHVAWQDCGGLSLCVNVSANNFEQLAAQAQSSANGQKTAAAAQSVLQSLAGTAKGDQFMTLLNRVTNDKAWDTLDTSGQGEGRAASRSAERAVSNFVQGLMQQGRSSGEDFSGARGLWLQALQTRGDGDKQNAVAGYEVDTNGLALGYDLEIQPGWVVGAALSSADTEVDADDRSSGVDTDTVMATVYSQWQKNAWFVNGVFTYGNSDHDGHRVVSGDVARADYDSNFVALRGQVGKGFYGDNGWVFRPRVDLGYSRVDVDSYSETGSIAALSVDDQRYESIELGAGIEISKGFIFDQMVLTPYLDLALSHDLVADRVQTTNRFAIGGNQFVTQGNDVERSNASATLGLNVARGEYHSLRAAYEYGGNSDYNASSWMLRYAYSF